MHSSCRTWVLSTPSPELQNFSINVRARSCLAPVPKSCAYTNILVSTKHLSLMKFVPRTSGTPTQTQACAESRQRTLLRAFVRLAFSHQFLEFRGQQAADRAALFGGQYSRFSQNLRVQLQCNVRFHFEHANTCSTILRAERPVVNPLCRCRAGQPPFRQRYSRKTFPAPPAHDQNQSGKISSTSAVPPIYEKQKVQTRLT